MADTGFVIAGTGGDDASVGTAAWTSPGNITTDDGILAEASIAGGSGGQSHYLRASNFGFSVPDGATIHGIEVRCQRHEVFAGPNSEDASIRLFNALGAVAGSEQSVGADWTTTPDTVKTFGGATDLWGLTPSANDVNDADWGWGMSAKNIGPSSSSLRCDVMEMKIYYTEAVTVVLMPQIWF